MELLRVDALAMLQAGSGKQLRYKAVDIAHSISGAAPYRMQLRGPGRGMQPVQAALRMLRTKTFGSWRACEQLTSVKPQHCGYSCHHGSCMPGSRRAHSAGSLPQRCGESASELKPRHVPHPSSRSNALTSAAWPPVQPAARGCSASWPLLGAAGTGPGTCSAQLPACRRRRPRS